MTATNVTEIKKVTKMSLGKTLFAEIFTPGYDLKGKTQRAEFIERGMKEHEFTKHGAGTYFQNLTNLAAGKPLYKYNKTKPKAKAATTKADVSAMEAQLLLLTHQASERWMAVNEEGVEINNFKTRSEAQKFAKDNGLKVADRSKAA